MEERPIGPISANDPLGASNGCKIIAIGGGKGGVGKTVIAASLSVGLSTMNRRVAAVDADLGCPNLHTVFGIQHPPHTIKDFFDGRKKDLASVLAAHENVPGLRIGCGAPGSYGLANIGSQQKIRFIQHLQRLDGDYAVLDLGAGTHYNTLDFFLAADLMVVLVTPDLLSILDAFGFVKQALYRRLSLALHGHPRARALVQARAGQKALHGGTIGELIDDVRRVEPQAVAAIHHILAEFQPSLLINKVRDGDDEAEGLALQVATQALLTVRMDYLGSVRFDSAVAESVKNTLPFLKYNPGAHASQDLAKIVVSKILSRKKMQAAFDLHAVRKRLRKRWDRRIPVNRCGAECLHWDQCPHKEAGSPCTIQHLMNPAASDRSWEGSREKITSDAGLRVTFAEDALDDPGRPL